MCDLVLLVVAEPLIRQGVLVEDALHGVLAPFELLVLVGLEVGFVVRGAEVVVNEHRFRRVVLPYVWKSKLYGTFVLNRTRRTATTAA